MCGRVGTILRWILPISGLPWIAKPPAAGGLVLGDGGSRKDSRTFAPATPCYGPNKDKADAILRGTALEKTSQEFHALNDKAAAATAAGGHSGSVGGSWSGGTGSISGSSSGGFVARAASADDSTASTETIDHARVAVRLVSPDGDVIWATTQESRGAKYKGASADVAEKIVQRLLRDIEKLEKPAISPGPPIGN